MLNDFFHTSASRHVLNITEDVLNESKHLHWEAMLGVKSLSGNIPYVLRECRYTCHLLPQHQTVGIHEGVQRHCVWGFVIWITCNFEAVYTDKAWRKFHQDAYFICFCQSYNYNCMLHKMFFMPHPICCEIGNLNDTISAAYNLLSLVGSQLVVSAQPVSKQKQQRQHRCTPCTGVFRCVLASL